MNVAFLDSRRGRAVGRNAKLLQTVDGGETWEVEQSGVSGETAINFLGIAWPSEKTVMVTTLFGYLLRHQESAIPAPPTILNPVSRSEDQPLSVSIEWVPVEGAIAQEIIDVVAVLNALRTARPITTDFDDGFGGAGGAM